MPIPLKLDECLWVRSPNSEHQVFRPAIKAIQARGMANYCLRMKSDSESLATLKSMLWKTDKHVVLHGLLPEELRAIRPILEARKNFSLVAIDWWTNPWWYTRHAEYIFFNLYSGIAVRTGQAKFCNAWDPPLLLSKPERMIPYHIAAAALRPFCVAARPFREQLRVRRLAEDDLNPKRFLYFPISIEINELPLGSERPRYDFSNLGATYGIWLMRDAHAPTNNDFANLYRDRECIADSMARCHDPGFQTFDRRRHGHLSWADYCKVVHESRYMIATGGLHEASIPKFLEYVGMGTPILGRPLPFEYPLLRSCIFTIDALNSSPEQIKARLQEAIEVQPKLREECLKIRDRLTRLYDPAQILDLLQNQLDGQPIPADYIRPLGT